MVIRSRFFTRIELREADWEGLYVENLPRVYNFFRYRVRNEAEAEDLTSETFERAWRARDRYKRDRGGFTTWLFTIARNLAVDHYRGRREMAPLEAAAFVSAGPTPEDVAAGRSDARRLRGLLEKLPDRERELIAWKYGADLTNREIARLCGLSESNVGTILHRAIKDLRAEWDGSTLRETRPTDIRMTPKGERS